MTTLYRQTLLGCFLLFFLGGCAPAWQQWVARNPLAGPDVAESLFTDILDYWGQPPAKDAFARLQRDFPDSPWTLRAQGLSQRLATQDTLSRQNETLKAQNDTLQQRLAKEKSRCQVLQNSIDERNRFIQNLKDLIIQNEMAH